MTNVQANEPARSMEEWRAQMDVKAANPGASFFKLSAQLPAAGRTNIVMGATPAMSVVLKTYASGGENELHAHPFEDHLFVVMQGSAKFYDADGKTTLVGKNECALIPRNTFYWFHAVEGDDALVLLRIGAALDPAEDPLERIDVDGKPFDGYSQENKEIPVVLTDTWFA